MQVMREQEKAHRAELKIIEKYERKASEAQDALGDCRFQWSRVQEEVWQPSTMAIETLVQEQQPLTGRTQEYLKLELGRTLNLQLRFDVQVVSIYLLGAIN